MDLRVSRVEFWVWSGFGAGLAGRGCAQAAEFAGKAALAGLGFCGDLGLGGLRLRELSSFWEFGCGLILLNLLGLDGYFGFALNLWGNG